MPAGLPGTVHLKGREDTICRAYLTSQVMSGLRKARFMNFRELSEGDM